MRLLLIEDDQIISNFIKRGLGEQGFAVDLAADKQEGLYLSTEEDYDLIILDLRLPDGNGLEICQSLRQMGKNVPILILTAKTGIGDRVEGLNAGADDYLTKPFAFAELQARIQALFRRAKSDGQPTLKAGNLELDPVKHVVLRGAQEIPVSPKEFAILEFLIRNKNQVVTRTMILEHVWDYNFETFSNIVDVYITHLRRKIDNNQPKKLIHTIHGVGFKIKD